MVSSQTDNTSVAAAVEAARSGGLVLLVLEDAGETRGDLMLAADHASAETLNTLLTRARGLLCLALGEEIHGRLDLRPEPIAIAFRNPRAPEGTTTIEATRGVSTGISSADRARTIRAATSADAAPGDVRQPGHVPVIRAAPGGLGERLALTEAAVEIAVLAGMKPAAVVCDVLGPDGEMADRQDLEAIARECGAVLLPIRTLAEQLEGKR